MTAGAYDAAGRKIIFPLSLEGEAAAKAEREKIGARLHRTPTYMEMEDLARYLDTLPIDPWAVKVVSGMRDALNEAWYLLRDEIEAGKLRLGK